MRQQKAVTLLPHQIAVPVHGVALTKMKGRSIIVKATLMVLKTLVISQRTQHRIWTVKSRTRTVARKYSSSCQDLLERSQRALRKRVFLGSNVTFLIRIEASSLTKLCFRL